MNAGIRLSLLTVFLRLYYFDALLLIPVGPQQGPAAMMRIIPHPRSDSITNSDGATPSDTLSSMTSPNEGDGAIEQATFMLLNSSNVGVWDEPNFRQAETIVEAWSERQSKRAALAVERLLRRIVKEQISGNPYADCLDMTALYTNLLKGWARCGEPGGAERAEEILDYFQMVYEDGDSYDPLLCEPGLESYNAVIEAYAKRGTEDAPQQAIRVLSKLYDLNRSGRTTAMPNKETYARMLLAIPDLATESLCT